MTIQINIQKTDLIQKLQICQKISHYYSLNNVFDYSKYINKFNYIREQIYSCGNYQEIYQDLQQIERELLEII